jgi:hypothetical protein
MALLNAASTIGIARAAAGSCFSVDIVDFAAKAGVIAGLSQE